MYVYIPTHVFVFIYLYTHMYYRRNPSEKSLRKLRFIRQTGDLRRTADRVENIVFARIRLGTHNCYLCISITISIYGGRKYDVQYPPV